MRKKLLLNSFLTFFSLICFCVFSKEQKVFAQELGETVDSPSQSCRLIQYMFNSGSTTYTVCSGNIYSRVDLNMTDEKIECYFTDLPPPEKLYKIGLHGKRKIFAVLIDSKKGPVDFQFLDKDLKCTLTPPYYSDSLAIHLYWQDEGDPDFLLREENFMCKTKFSPVNDNLFYKKCNRHSIRIYDSEGKERFVNNVDKRASIWQKYTPNTYSLGEFFWLTDDVIAVIEFPNGEHEEMSYEDRVFPMCKFTTTAKDLDGIEDSQKHVMPSSKYYFNFKIPADVKEFTIKTYVTGIYECLSGGENLFDQYFIKLEDN